MHVRDSNQKLRLGFYDIVLGGYPEGQPELAGAVEGATRRAFGGRRDGCILQA